MSLLIWSSSQFMPQEYYPKMWLALETSLVQILKPENTLSSKGLTSILKAFNTQDTIDPQLEAKLWQTYESRFKSGRIDPTLVAMVLMVAAKSKHIDFV